MSRKIITILSFCIGFGFILGSGLVTPAQAGGVQPCDSSADCDDNNGCTTDTCIVGTCAFVTCEQFNPQPQCMRFVCDSGDSGSAGPDDSCIVEADPSDNGSSCNDGVGCTVNDQCSDGDCAGTPDDGTCDNGQHCDGAETCDAVSDCQPGTAPNCDDGVGCTDDSCNEGTDSCDNLVNNGLCDNGQHCDGVETCHVTDDCQSGQAPNCDDGVGCTDDSCNEGTDSCDNLVNNGLCDNGQHCDGVETCHVTDDCQSGPAPNCDDGVGCTDDSCNEGTDSCDNLVNNGLCDNGQHCDGVETCHLTDDCQSGPAPDCNDDVDCTEDSCNEGTDSCDNLTNDGLCDNGQYCDGVETCDAVDDCQDGTAVDCNDSVSCTADQCNEGTDSCDNDPIDALCTNGMYCDGAEICDPDTDCQPGTPPDCSDGVGCTDDSCNEGTDSCENLANDGLCDNGQHCDGIETCHVNADCQDGTPVECGHLDDQCKEGVCDEEADACAAENFENGLPCTDEDSCSRFDACYEGECEGVDRCGDANIDGQKNILDCLKIIVHGVGGGGECPPDSCDMTGDCSVTIVDALGCLHCAVGLPTCPNNCPTAVGFSSNHEEESPLLESSIFGVDYSFAPGKFCKAGGEAICQPLVNQIDPADSLLSIVPEFLGTQIFPTLDQTAVNVAPSGYLGPHYAQCYFWIDPLSPANPLDAGDFAILGGDLAPVGVPLGGGPGIPLDIHPEICPACGDGVCNPEDWEDPWNCQVDCGFDFF